MRYDLTILRRSPTIPERPGPGLRSWRTIPHRVILARRDGEDVLQPFMTWVECHPDTEQSYLILGHYFEDALVATEDYQTRCDVLGVPYGYLPPVEQINNPNAPEDA